jgi:hypothetical protein
MVVSSLMMHIGFGPYLLSPAEPAHFDFGQVLPSVTITFLPN